MWDAKRTRLVVAFLLAATVVVVLWVFLRPGEPPKAGEADLPVVRLNIVTWPGYGPLYVGMEKGFFRQEGVEVQTAIQENSDARRAALIAGQIDLIGITLETVVLERAKGLPVTAIGVTDISTGGDGIVAKQGITKVADLAGKTVAYPVGQPSHLYLLHLLDQAQVPFDSILPRHTDDAGKAGELFAAGQVDAAVTWEPWLSTAEEAGKGKVIVRSDGKAPILIGIFQANSSRLTPQGVDKLSRFLRGWYRSLSYVTAHRAETMPTMARAFSLPPEEFEAIMGGLRFIELPEARELFGLGVNRPRLVDAALAEAQLWRKAGLIDGTERTRGAVDARPMRAAFAE